MGHQTTYKGSYDEGRDPISKVAFGINDERGREIGAVIQTGVREFVTITDEQAASRGCFSMAPGVYYWFTPHATRNGHTYGPLQRCEYFATAAERDAAVEKYLVGAKKRAAKKAAAAAAKA